METRRAARWRVVGFAAMTVATALCGCSIGSGGVRPPPPPPPDPISVEVYQNRTDVAARTLQVAVTNASGATLVVDSLVLHSDQFVAPARWAKKSTTIAPGVTANLPVPLASVDCDAGAPLPQIDLEYRFDEGEAHRSTLVATDRLGQLPQISATDCLLAGVNDVVQVAASTAPTISTTGETPTARLDLTLTPTGGIGTVTFRSVRSTTLLGVGATDDAPLPLTVSGTDAPALLSLNVRPARCDAHAIADDKRGTIIPVDVMVGDLSGEIAVAASDAVREDLYAFVRAACSAQTAPG